MKTVLTSVLFLVVVCESKLIQYTAIEDLSYSLDENTLYWDQGESFSSKTVFESDLYITKNFSGGEHGGTHIDAPFHFNKQGWKVDQIPICHFFTEGVLIDVSKKVNDNADFELLPEHIEEWEKANGQLPDSCIVLVNFGWSHRYNNRVSYFGASKPPYSFPGISKSAAEYLVNSGKVIGVGVDVPSLDGGKRTSFDTHTVLFKSNIFGFENVLLNGTKLPPKSFYLVTLPMKIKDGSGGPVRIVALY